MTDRILALIAYCLAGLSVLCFLAVIICII